VVGCVSDGDNDGDSATSREQGAAASGGSGRTSTPVRLEPAPPATSSLPHDRHGSSHSGALSCATIAVQALESDHTSLRVPSSGKRRLCGDDGSVDDDDHRYELPDADDDHGSDCDVDRVECESQSADDNDSRGSRDSRSHSSSSRQPQRRRRLLSGQDTMHSSDDMLFDDVVDVPAVPVVVRPVFVATVTPVPSQPALHARGINRASVGKGGGEEMHTQASLATDSDNASQAFADSAAPVLPAAQCTPPPTRVRVPVAVQVEALPVVAVAAASAVLLQAPVAAVDVEDSLLVLLGRLKAGTADMKHPSMCASAEKVL
jgi:hypothetical protein